MTDTTLADAATSPNWVQVAVLGGDVTTLDYTEGQTVRQALEAADVTVDRGQVVTRNGAPVNDVDETLEAGTVLNVVGRVKNG